MNKLFEFIESDGQKAEKTQNKNDVIGVFRYTGSKIRNTMKLGMAGLKNEYFHQARG
jgi:hypothetical protein